jgi:hypothetical protein
VELNKNKSWRKKTGLKSSLLWHVQTACSVVKETASSKRDVLDIFLTLVNLLSLNNLIVNKSISFLVLVL